MEFEWDAKKATANLRRHGIVFADAVHVFERPYLERLDERRDYGEDRYVIYGEMRNQVIVLVFTWRRTREEDNQCKKSDPVRTRSVLLDDLLEVSAVLEPTGREWTR